MTYSPADCWAALRHGGLLISPEILDATFPKPPPRLNDFLAERLLREVQRVTSPQPDDSAAGDLITTVLEKVCGLRIDHGMYWERGNDVAPRWAFRALSGEVVRPRRVWYTQQNGRLPVFVDDESRLGVGRGRRSVSRVIEWCRSAGEPLALITNARQWRLMYVGAEHDAWAEWDADLWFPDGVPGPQIAALQLLLNPDTITPPAAGAEARLLQAINRTRQGQSKLSSSLGERARQAVE